MTLQFAVGGAVMPFVSMLLRDRGLEYSRISQVFFASSCTLLVFPFLWGMLADRVIPMNRLFTFLNLGGLCALGVFSLQQSFAGLLLSFTVFYACFHPTMTLMNALSFHHLDHPESQFANVRAWGSFGWIIPSVPIYFWLFRAPSTRLDFVLYLGMGISLAMALAALRLPHTPPRAPHSAAESGKEFSYSAGLKRLMRNTNYLVILISFFLVSGSFSLAMFYSPPLLEDIGIHRAWIEPIQCIGVVVEIALVRCLPAWTRRWDYAATILPGCLCLLSGNCCCLATIVGALRNVLAGWSSSTTSRRAFGSTPSPASMRATAQTLSCSSVPEWDRCSPTGPRDAHGRRWAVCGPSSTAAALAALANS